MEKNMEQALTERQLREKEYYSQYAKLFDLNQDIDFSPILGPLLNKEKRPWNSYWRTYELPIELILKNNTQTTTTLLDFGCGPGDNSLRFWRAGFKVHGFDISDANINNCQNLFSKNQAQGEFLVSAAETLPFDNEAFDVIVGIDILHHVDIERSMKEIRRTLKPNGIAIFREPVEVSLLDKIRNTALVKAIVPNHASLENHITEDERKLNQRDFDIIKKEFPKTQIERSLVLSRFDKFVRKHDDKTASVLERMDYGISKVLPFWGKLGGAAVIIIKK